jgi:peptide chain release factor 3
VILGAVGQLQLEVVKYRLKDEYGVDVRYEAVQCAHARWVSRKDGSPVDVARLQKDRAGTVVVDVRGRPVVLFAGDWQLNAALRDLPGYIFAETASGVLVLE